MPANTIFNGDVIGTASIASSVLPAGLPSGIISSSIQFNALSGTTASFATTASFVTNATPDVAALWAYSNIL